MTADWAWPGDDPRWNNEAATLRFGPAPPDGRTNEPSPTRRTHQWIHQWIRRLRSTFRSRRTLLLAGGAASMALVGLAIVAIDATDPGASAAATSDPSCKRAAGIVADAPSGCVDAWSYDTSTAVLMTDGGVNFTIGEPGDVLAIGDWDCDGELTPGLYRPSTGEVFYFAAFAADEGTATSGPPTPTGVIDGTATVLAADPDPPRSSQEGPECHRLVIMSR